MCGSISALTAQLGGPRRDAERDQELVHEAETATSSTQRVCDPSRTLRTVVSKCGEPLDGTITRREWGERERASAAPTASKLTVPGLGLEERVERGGLRADGCRRRQEHFIDMAPVPLWRQHLNTTATLPPAWRLAAAERRDLEPFGRRAEPPHTPLPPPPPPPPPLALPEPADDEARKPAALPLAKRLQWVWRQSSARSLATAVWDGGPYRCGRRNATQRAFRVLLLMLLAAAVAGRLLLALSPHVISAYVAVARVPPPSPPSPRPPPLSWFGLSFLAADEVPRRRIAPPPETPPQPPFPSMPPPPDAFVEVWRNVSAPEGSLLTFPPRPSYLAGTLAGLTAQPPPVLRSPAFLRSAPWANRTDVRDRR